MKFFKRASSTVWRWQYVFEELRQQYAARRQLIRQAICCILLACVGGGR